MKLELDKSSKALYMATIGILLIGLCFVVMGPLFSNASIAPAPAEPVAAQPAKDPIEAFMEERAGMREQERLSLQKIMDDGDADQGLKAEAGARLMRLMNWTEQETTIEGVLRIRGYEDAVVTVHQDSANVLVRRASLTRQESAQVMELVSRETGLLGGNIKIIPIG